MQSRKSYFCVIILIIELFVLLGCFFNFEVSNILKAKYLPATFYIFYIVAFGITVLLFYPKEVHYYFKNFLNKYCLPDTEMKNYETSENIEKLQDKIILPQKESTVTVQEIQNATPKKEKDEFSKIFEHMETEKYELVISEIQTKLSSIKNEKKEFLCRLILYYAYIDCKNDSFLDDAIENLKIFIPLAKKYEKEIYMEARLNIIIAYAKQGKYDKVKQENCRFINEIYKDSKVSADTKKRCYQMQAIIYLKEKNITYAMGYFEKASQYDENNSEILFNMALVYYYTEKNIDKCLECIEKIDRTSIKDKEQFKLLIIMQYYCLALRKQYEEAYEIIAGYQLSENGLPTEMKGHKAYIAYKMNFFQEAKKLSDEVLSTIYDTTAMNVRAMIQIEDGLYREAISNFTKIIPDFSEDTDKYYLGEIYYKRSCANLKLNNFAEAINDYKQAIMLGFMDYASDYIIDLDMAETKCMEAK